MPTKRQSPLQSLLIVAPILAACASIDTKAGAEEDAQQALRDYLAAAPIENFLLQPEVLPDDPSDEFFLVFDVRSKDELGTGEMLPSAKHLPYTDLGPLLDALGEDRSQPALLYCQTMLRSTQVVMALRLLGYDNVWYLAGGIERWRSADKPIVHLDALAD